MPVSELHRRIDEIAPRALLAGPEDPDISAMEEHASSGCSACSRALVNARDIAFEMASAAPSRAPSPWVRASLLERAAHPGGAAVHTAADQVIGKDPRVFDPSALVAHMHITGPDEAERAREIDELEAYASAQPDQDRDQGESAPEARVLAQIERLLGFPLHFVSIMRGERVGYRVQRGLSSDVVKMLGTMRREMTFCTHCVSAGGSLVIRNSAAEPFFRGNPAAVRHRIRAYAGVPLRTSRDIVVGTLCALDYRPRVIPPELVRVLELFAKRVVAEIERPRDAAGLDALVVDPPRGGVYRRGFFEDLLAIELARASSEGRSSALVAIAGGSRADLAALAALAAENEVVGEMDDGGGSGGGGGGGGIAILLSGAGAEQVKARCAALSSALLVEEGLQGGGEASTKPRFAVTYALAGVSFPTPSAWIEAARGL